MSARTWEYRYPTTIIADTNVNTLLTILKGARGMVVRLRASAGGTLLIRYVYPSGTLSTERTVTVVGGTDELVDFDYPFSRAVVTFTPSAQPNTVECTAEVYG